MGKRSFDFTRKENRLATGDLDFCPSTYSAVFFGGWLKQGRFGTKEFLIKKTKLGMFLGTPSFLKIILTMGRSGVKALPSPRSFKHF